MRLIITGTPGVGKTSVAEALRKRLKLKALNERHVALKEKIGGFEEGEYAIPLDEFRKALKQILHKKGGLILEGHTLCEIKLKADAIVVLREKPEKVEARLRGRGYSEEKVQDNVMCEGIDYCKKYALRNYGKEKLIEVHCGKTVKETVEKVLKELKQRGLK